MSDLWAFFCESCQFTSGISYPDPIDARQAFVEGCAELERLRSAQGLRTPTQELASLFFVAEHASHRVWLVSDAGWLRLVGPCSEHGPQKDDAARDVPQNP